MKVENGNLVLSTGTEVSAFQRIVGLGIGEDGKPSGIYGGYDQHIEDEPGYGCELTPAERVELGEFMAVAWATYAHKARAEVEGKGG